MAEETILKIDEQRMDLPGVVVEAKRCDYPHGNLACYLIGANCHHSQQAGGVYGCRYGGTPTVVFLGWKMLMKM